MKKVWLMIIGSMHLMCFASDSHASLKEVTQNSHSMFRGEISQACMLYYRKIGGSIPADVLEKAKADLLEQTKGDLLKSAEEISLQKHREILRVYMVVLGEYAIAKEDGYTSTSWSINFKDRMVEVLSVSSRVEKDRYMGDRHTMDSRKSYFAFKYLSNVEVEGLRETIGQVINDFSKKDVSGKVCSKTWIALCKKAEIPKGQWDLDKVFQFFERLEKK
jgi:hypothetical protein